MLIILGQKGTSVIRNVSNHMIILKCNITHAHMCILSHMNVHLSTHFMSMRVLTNITQVYYLSRGSYMRNFCSKDCSCVYCLY